MAGQGAGPGSIARAGAGMTVPTQGSTVGDMADTMGKVLAGMEARRQANEAKALEQAKLAVSRQQADAQTTQANAYQASVDTQTHESGVRIRETIQQMDLREGEAERAAESHNMEMAGANAELGEYQAQIRSRRHNAPVNRTILRDAALSAPGQVPWPVSAVDQMDDIALAENVNWWRGQLNARTNQLGAAGGAAVNGVSQVYDRAVSAAQDAAAQLRQAKVDTAARRTEALSTGFFRETADGPLELIDMAGHERQSEIAAMNVSYQQALAMEATLTEQYGQAQLIADNTQSMMRQTISNIEAALGVQMDTRVRGALGASADDILGPDPAAQGGANPAQNTVAGDLNSATWVTSPIGRQLPAPSSAVMEGLSRAFVLDPHVYEQQVASLRGRFPGIDIALQQTHGIDGNAIQTRKIELQRLSMQEAQDRVYTLGGVQGAAQDALSGISYLIRSGQEGRLMDDSNSSLEIADMVRRLANSGMTRDTFAAHMREQLPRVSLQQSFVYDFVYNRLPNRIPTGGN